MLSYCRLEFKTKMNLRYNCIYNNLTKRIFFLVSDWIISHFSPSFCLHTSHVFLAGVSWPMKELKTIEFLCCSITRDHHTVLLQFILYQLMWQSWIACYRPSHCFLVSSVWVVIQCHHTVKMKTQLYRVYKCLHCQNWEKCAPLTKIGHYCILFPI